MGSSSSTQGGNLGATGLRQVEDTKNPLYNLLDFRGGGELIKWLKYGQKSGGDFGFLEGIIEVKVGSFLYGEGKGKLLPIAELVKRRNKERNAASGALRKKKGKGKSGPNILENINQDEMQGDMMKALKFLDGGGKGKGGSKYRELCWDIDKRGVMGETILHLCLLNDTYFHNELAKRLVAAYPKLVNDIFISEDYYGQTPLHQAIVNEDPNMVRFLLFHGADTHERCVGAFYCLDDQKDTRTDSLEHEWVEMSQKTNYKGRTYWGEFPLSFAACLNQEDCFRLLRAKKADPNRQDTNGNTVLHLMVIHENTKMFDLAHKLGAKLHVTNNQGLTPLTLAAKLGKRKMFNHVVELEKDILWNYSNVESAAYPLVYIDTIDQQTGKMNRNSALAHIVYGETAEHLDMLDGLMEELLTEKWKAYAKIKLLNQFRFFVLYFVIFFTAFLLRQTRPPGGFDPIPPENQSDYALTTTTTRSPHVFVIQNNHTRTTPNPILEILLFNETEIGNETAWNILDYYKQPSCYHWKSDSVEDKVRLFAEGFTLIGVIGYIISFIRDTNYVGFKQYFKTFTEFPGKVAFYLSFVGIFLMIPSRLACFYDIENVLGLFCVICTGLHFLFFCRALAFVGPFVLMVYKMIAGDMLRFIMIYSIFLIGFSQAFFIIFQACSMMDGKDEKEEKQEHFMSNPLEAIIRMFIISVGEFMVFYKQLNECPWYFSGIGKVVFVIYEMMVTIMLVNMLIATMGRTYQLIAETQKEYIRQWAQVILMLEQSLPPRDRLIALLKYSRPIGINKLKRSFVVKRKITEEEHLEQTKERADKWVAYMEERKTTMKKKLVEGTSIPASRMDFHND